MSFYLLSSMNSPEKNWEEKDLTTISLENAEYIAKLIAAVNHPNRIKILGLLCEKPVKFGLFKKEINLERTAISNHLTFLMERGLISKTSYGVYEITEDGKNLLKTIVDVYMKSKMQQIASQKKKEEELLLKYRNYNKMGEVRGMIKIDWNPKTKENEEAHYFYLGLAKILNFLGDNIKYETIMGDSGQAFITQGAYGKNTTDPGWWPIENGLLPARLNFLEQTVGRKLKCIEGKWEDMDEQYKKTFKPAFKEVFEKKIPCIIEIPHVWFIATGLDDGIPPMYGKWLGAKEDAKVDRIKGNWQESPWPTFMVAPTENIEKLDRKISDLRALHYAICLHRNQVFGPNITFKGESIIQNQGLIGKYWQTGSGAYKAWIKILEDKDNVGFVGWHWQMIRFLRINRISAIKYLQAMGERHSKQTVKNIDQAIKKYTQIIEFADYRKITEELNKTSEGRQPLIKEIHKIMELELEAANALEEAVESIV